MSGRNARLLRKFCEITKRSKKELRRAKKKFGSLSTLLKEQYRDTIYDQTTQVKLKMEALKYA